MKQIAGTEQVNKELSFKRALDSAGKNYVGTRTKIAKDVKPEFGTVLEAQYAQNNTIGSLIANIRNGTYGDDGIDPNYDPTDDIPEDKLMFWDSYARAESPREVEFITNKIDKELERVSLLESADLKTQLVTGLIAGVTDPVNFIPVGGVAFRAGRLAKIGQAAKTTATAGLISSIATETMLQSQQETRTTEESLINITADTLFAGLIGGAAGAFSKGNFQTTSKAVLDDINTSKSEYELNAETQQLQDSVGAKRYLGELEDAYKQHVEEALQAGKNPQTFEQFQNEKQSLAKGLGAAKVAKSINKINPILRVFNSQSIKAKELLQQLNTHNMIVAKNEIGIASQQSIETSIKRWRGPLATGVKATRDAYKSYKKRIKAEGVEQQLKNPLQFNEAVSKSLRRGDVSDIQEVAQVAKIWRSKVFDPLKNEAIEVNLLPKDVMPKTAVSYLTRRWNREKVIAQSSKLKGILKNKLQTFEIPRLIKSGDFEGVDDVESYIDDVVDDILDNLTGHNTYNVDMPYDIKVTTRGPLKERTLTFVDDVEIEEFLDSDIEKIADGYTRIMATDVELKRQFGDVNLDKQFQDINNEYRDLRNKAKTEKERIAIEKESKQVIGDLMSLKDLMRGNYGKLNDPDSFIAKGARIARNVNYMSKLGGVAISSIPDIMRPVMIHGMTRVFSKGLKNVITNLEGIKLNVKEAQLAGNVLENVLNTRLATLAELQDPYNSASTTERFFSNLSAGFSKVTGMTYWNDAMKGFTSVLTQQRIIEESNKLLKGTIKKNDKTYLASLGISKLEAERIVSQINKHATKEDGLFVANTETWTDGTAVRLYRNALNQDVDRTIVTKTLGDTPLLMNTELGKTIGQFKSFTFAATQQVLIAGLQQRDAAALQGVITMIGFGGLVYYLKQKGAKKEVSDDPRVWLAEGIDRSGLLGVFMEVNNISEKLTRGTVGINALTGGEIMSRYASRNISGTLLGPTLGTIEDTAKITGAIATGDITESDVRAFRRMTPYQNVFYIRGLFDNLEAEINKNIGTNER
jgi:hypothetical protein